ncbi:hypothetical protein PA27867_2666 [Cryobacterium arcticum]|uniref:Uncharacterized protein n=1 Tax=Cryobacterium arcticum TaxID=670052 RepID=A0A1B1BM84_9MICO|nr:hypothetical protein PA27867_2666 [Cryobacterium arcticum]
MARGGPLAFTVGGADFAKVRLLLRAGKLTGRVPVVSVGVRWCVREVGLRGLLRQAQHGVDKLDRCVVAMCLRDVPIPVVEVRWCVREVGLRGLDKLDRRVVATCLRVVPISLVEPVETP